VHRDNSLSAWSPKVVRPQWEALMRRLESGACDGVIVYDLTRFSRKVLEGERLVDLAAGGVRVWSLSGEYDLTTADGRRHFREAMVAAAGESDKTSERTRRGKLRRARRGKGNGGPRSYAMPGFVAAPDGWEPGDPRERVPDEQVAAEREIVRECYRRLFAGEPLSELVADLNRRGVPTATGGRWARNAMRRTLCRAPLAGLTTYRGEEWERMCALFEARRAGRPAGRVHVLSGLMLCGVCGRPMLALPRVSEPPYPDGSVRREYRCRRTVDYDGCGRNHIDARAAEQAVGVAVKARLGDPRRAEQLAKRLVATQARRAKIEAEIGRWEDQADALAAKTVTWGVERVDRSMGPILKRLTELREQLTTLDDGADAGAAAEDAAREWDAAEAAADFATMRAMVRRAFPRLTVLARRGPGDHSPDRLDWDGQSLPADAA
jgi:site-specific DNA recombinase